ncbi:MAG: hypothetical protein H6R12_2454 [Proteobacteria bacterium]|nr:hypothetical protein [Pseudomonadota bacterium]
MALSDNGSEPGRSGGALPLPGLLGKVVAIAAGAVLLVGAFLFSIVVFGIVVIAGLLAWGYLWWKTKDLRQQMRRQQPGGRVIEGEAIREVGSEDDARH